MFLSSSIPLTWCREKEWILLCKMKCQDTSSPFVSCRFASHASNFDAISYFVNRLCLFRPYSKLLIILNNVLSIHLILTFQTYIFYNALTQKSLSIQNWYISIFLNLFDCDPCFVFLQIWSQDFQSSWRTTLD